MVLSLARTPIRSIAEMVPLAMVGPPRAHGSLLKTCTEFFVLFSRQTDEEKGSTTTRSRCSVLATNFHSESFIISTAICVARQDWFHRVSPF